MFEFEILAKSSSKGRSPFGRKHKARVGEFKTPHGKLLTPELSFVATEGELKSIPKDILPKLPVKLIIVNTFHLWTKNIINKPAVDLRGRQQASTTIYSFIHNYSNFPHPIMSDSGGFQVFSLGFSKTHGVGKIANIFPEENKIAGVPSGGISDSRNANISDQNLINNQNNVLLSNQPHEQKQMSTDGRINEGQVPQFDNDNPLTITEKGVTFPWNGTKLLLTPELSMDLQQKIGADIIFAFDECTSPLNSYLYTKAAMERTHRWMKRCLKVKQTIEGRKWKIDNEDRRSSVEKNPQSSPPQALFAIVQGGYFEDLRKKSAEFMAKQDVPGFGIGGSLGRSKEDVWKVLEWTIPRLPDEKPRHLLGIGQVKDLFESVERGVDTFDCVIPTREARHKILYTKNGKINIRKAKNIQETPDKNCKCQGCKEDVTYKKLYQFFLDHDPRSFYYATLHNIQFFTDLTKSIRHSIENNSLEKLKEKYLKYY